MKDLSQKMIEAELVSVLARFHSPALFLLLSTEETSEAERMESGRRARKSDDDSLKVYKK